MAVLAAKSDLPDRGGLRRKAVPRGNALRAVNALEPFARGPAEFPRQSVGRLALARPTA